MGRGRSKKHRFSAPVFPEEFIHLVSLKPEFLYSSNKKCTTVQRLGRDSCLMVQTQRHGILKKYAVIKNTELNINAAPKVLK